jgi:riboflavin transporter FmnP
VPTIFRLEGEPQLQRLDTKKLALASVLAALAAASEVIKGPPFDIPFPLLPGIVSWDLTGVPMMISLLFTGSIGGVYTSIIGCSIIFLRGNVAGGIFKLVAELATILAFAAIRRGVVTKSITAVASRVFVMTIVNYFALPFFYPKYYPSEAAVVGILLPLAVFNLTQALLNIVPAYIIYARLGDWWRLQMQDTKPLDSAAIKT